MKIIAAKWPDPSSHVDVRASPCRPGKD